MKKRNKQVSEFQLSLFDMGSFFEERSVVEEVSQPIDVVSTIEEPIPQVVNPVVACAAVEQPQVVEEESNDITLKEVFKETNVFFKTGRETYHHVCLDCFQTTEVTIREYQEGCTVKPTCNCQVTRPYVSKFSSSPLEYINIQAIHLYPESEDVIRLACYSEELSLTIEGLSEASFIEKLNQPMTEIGSLRFHLDGTVEQEGDIDFLNQNWRFGLASGRTPEVDAHWKTFGAYNRKFNLRNNTHYYGHRLNNELKVIAYEPDVTTKGTNYREGTTQPFYFKVDPVITLMKHPVAQRHPYFYVFNKENQMGIGAFMDQFTTIYRLFSTYPQLEQIAKSGLTDVVNEMIQAAIMGTLDEEEMMACIKPGNNLMEITGLSKALVRALRDEMVGYQAYQAIVKTHEIQPLHEESLRILSEICEEIHLETFWRCIRQGYAGAVELIMYIRSCWNNQGIKASDALKLWEDYITMSMAAELPFKKFPKTLKKEHDVLVRDVEIIKQEQASKAFEIRAKSLDYLNFEDEDTGFGVYVPQTCEDLISEGRKLNHCVGSYQERFANGQTTILFVRTLEEPNKSLYTLEWDLKQGKQIQFRGHSNADVTDRDALDCLEKWKKKCAILGKNK